MTPVTSDGRAAIRFGMRWAMLCLTATIVGCGSSSSVEGVESTRPATSLTTVTSAPVTTVPGTTTPVEEVVDGDISPEADFCSAFIRQQDLLDELEEPGADAEAVWGSIVEVAGEMTRLSPPGFEDELSRMEQAWGEFHVVVAEYDYDQDAAENEFDLISEELGLDEPEVIEYAFETCL